MKQFIAVTVILSIALLLHVVTSAIPSVSLEGTNLFTQQSLLTLTKKIQNKNINIIRVRVPLPQRTITLSIVSKKQLLWVQPYALLFTFGTLNAHLAIESLEFLPVVSLNVTNEMMYINTTMNGSWKTLRNMFPKDKEYGSLVSGTLLRDIQALQSLTSYLVCFSETKPVKGREDVIDRYFCRSPEDPDALTQTKLDQFQLGTMCIFHVLKFAIAGYLFYYVISKTIDLQKLSEELAEHDLHVTNSVYEPPLYQNMFPRLLPLKLRVNFHIWEVWRLLYIHIILYGLAVITVLTRLFWPELPSDNAVWSFQGSAIKIPVIIVVCATNAVCTVIKLFFSKVGSDSKEENPTVRLGSGSGSGSVVRRVFGDCGKLLFSVVTSTIITGVLYVANFYTCQPFNFPLYAVDVPMFVFVFLALVVAFSSSQTKSWNVQGRIFLQFLTCGLYNFKPDSKGYRPTNGSLLKKIFMCVGWLLDAVWIVTLFVLGLNTGVVLYRLAMCTMANLTIDTNTVALYSFFITVGTTLYSFIGDVEKPFESVKDFLLDKRWVRSYEQMERENNNVLNWTAEDVTNAYLEKDEGRFRIITYRHPITWRQYIELCEIANIERLSQAKIFQFVITLVILSVFFLGLSTFDPRFIGGENKQLFTIISSSFLPLVPTLMKYLQGRNSDISSKSIQNRLQKGLERIERTQRALIFNDQTGKQLVKDIGFELCLIDAVQGRTKALQAISKVKSAIKRFRSQRRTATNGDYELMPTKDDKTEALLPEKSQDV